MVCSSTKMEESAWSSTCRTFEVSGGFPRGRPGNDMEWNAVIRGDLKERKVRKDLAKVKNRWKSFVKKQSNLYKHGKQTLK